jgi:hypothetical protein
LVRVRRAQPGIQPAERQERLDAQRARSGAEAASQDGERDAETD